MKLTSTKLGETETEDILVKLMGDLASMGYSYNWRVNMLKSAMIGYNRVLAKVAAGVTTRNRKGAVTLANRRFQKILGNTEWFRVESETDAQEIMPPWKRKSKIELRKLEILQTTGM